MQGTIREPNFRNPLSFAPTTPAVDLPKACDFSNSRPDRQRLNVHHWAEQLEMHGVMVPKSRGSVNGKDSLARHLPPHVTWRIKEAAGRLRMWPQSDRPLPSAPA